MSQQLSNATRKPVLPVHISTYDTVTADYLLGIIRYCYETERALSLCTVHSSTDPRLSYSTSFLSDFLAREAPKLSRKILREIKHHNDNHLSASTSKVSRSVQFLGETLRLCVNTNRKTYTFTHIFPTSSYVSHSSSDQH